MTREDKPQRTIEDKGLERTDDRKRTKNKRDKGPEKTKGQRVQKKKRVQKGRTFLMRTKN